MWRFGKEGPTPEERIGNFQARETAASGPEAPGIGFQGQSVQIQVGRLLGIGEKTITIDGSKLEQLQDRIRLMMSSDQVRSLPEAKGPGNSAQR